MNNYYSKHVKITHIFTWYLKIQLKAVKIYVLIKNILIEEKTTLSAICSQNENSCHVFGHVMTLREQNDVRDVAL